MPVSNLRIRTLALLALVVPLGFGLSHYDGPGAWAVNNWGASLAYELFFVCLVFLILPRPGRIGLIAVSVCAATCLLEFLQLWQVPWLEALRATYLGRSLLGHEFSWLDLPAYPAGCLLGWALLRRTARTEGRRPRL